MKLEHIKNIKLFNQIEGSDLLDIDARIAWNKYPENLSLLSHHEESDDVYFISYGCVKATTFSLSGKEIAYQTLESGEMFGEISAIDQKDRSTSVVVMENSVIGKMSANDLWWIIEIHPSVVKQLLLRLTGLVRFLCGRVYEYGALGVSDRIRAEILRHAKESANGKNSAVIETMPTHEEIANRVSTHREAVTKEFSYLYKDGFIEKDGKKINVPDIQRLTNLIVEFI